MSKEFLVYVRHMIDAIKKIESYTKEMDSQKFLNNKMVQDAVMRNLEIMGEAAKRVPSSIRSQYPSIEWKKIAGLRDILIHEYLGVDVEKVWGVVENRLTSLKKNLTKVINGH